MARKLLTSWLNDAYAMEQEQIKMLEQFIKDFEPYPDVTGKLEMHLEQTRQQAEDVKQCLERIGEKVSPVKSIIGNMRGVLQGMSTGPYRDESVKNMILIHAGEHFEHATYIALYNVAQVMGEEEIAQVCARIASEEKTAADWAESVLPELVGEVMAEASEKSAE